MLSKFFPLALTYAQWSIRNGFKETQNTVNKILHAVSFSAPHLTTLFPTENYSLKQQLISNLNGLFLIFKVKLGQVSIDLL